MTTSRRDYQTRVSQYAFQINAAALVTGIAPAHPSRNYLLIQNNGANPMAVSFGKPCGSGSDFVIAAGGSHTWAVRVPMQSINLSSALGTSGIIIEGSEP